MNDSSPLSSPSTGHSRSPWNKDKIVGPRPPLRPGHVWSIRAKLHLELRARDLALFNLAIDSKLRGCDLVALRVDDVAPQGYAIDRANVRQWKTSTSHCVVAWASSCREDALLKINIIELQIERFGDAKTRDAE